MQRKQSSIWGIAALVILGLILLRLIFPFLKVLVRVALIVVVIFLIYAIWQSMKQKR